MLSVSIIGKLPVFKGMESLRESVGEKMYPIVSGYFFFPLLIKTNITELKCIEGIQIVVARG